jgi:hypothetical protein
MYRNAALAEAKANRDGDRYKRDEVQWAWEAWQARAAFPQPVAQTERALTDQMLEKLYWTAMDNAADILRYMEDARALLTTAQPASGDHA